MSSGNGQLPNSKKVHVSGTLHSDIRVPFREISLAPTKTMSGEIEINEPVRVYDTSGPWGDPSVTLDPVQGLPALRRDWILARGDVQEIDGRDVKPIDDGFLSEKHAASRNGNGHAPFNRAQRKVLRAKTGAVTQLAYARKGIITPEMEFIAIRENGRTSSEHLTTDQKVLARNDRRQQHVGESFGANIPREIPPEFVRDEVARGRAI